MLIDQTKKNEEPLSNGTRIFVFIIGLASAPGYVTALILVPGYIQESIVGRYYHSPSYDQEVNIVRGIVSALALLGILTHAVALSMASIGSFSGMGRRGKVLAWRVVLVGSLAGRLPSE